MTSEERRAQALDEVDPSARFPGPHLPETFTQVPLFFPEVEVEFRLS